MEHKKICSAKAFRSFIGLVLCLVLGLSLGAPVLAAETENIRLNAPGGEVNVPFSVENMFPGDEVTQDYSVTVSHRNDITLYFRADIEPGSEKLAEVLEVRIELPEKDTVLYEGLLRDMPKDLAHDLAAGEKTVLYRITAWLDTSVGNDYMNKSLVADFIWWYFEEPAPTQRPGTTPATGDDAPIALLAVIVVICAAALVVVILLSRRKKEGRHG